MRIKQFKKDHYMSGFATEMLKVYNEQIRFKIYPMEGYCLFYPLTEKAYSYLGIVKLVEKDKLKTFRFYDYSIRSYILTYYLEYYETDKNTGTKCVNI